MVPVSLKDKYTVTRDESKNACDWVQRVASVLIQLGHGCRDCGIYPFLLLLIAKWMRARQAEFRAVGYIGGNSSTRVVSAGSVG